MGVSKIDEDVDIFLCKLKLIKTEVKNNNVKTRKL